MEHDLRHSNEMMVGGGGLNNSASILLGSGFGGDEDMMMNLSNNPLANSQNLTEHLLVQAFTYGVNDVEAMQEYVRLTAQNNDLTNQDYLLNQINFQQNQQNQQNHIQNQQNLQHLQNQQNQQLHVNQTHSNINPLQNHFQNGYFLNQTLQVQNLQNQHHQQNIYSRGDNNIQSPTSNFINQPKPQHNSSRENISTPHTPIQSPMSSSAEVLLNGPIYQPRVTNHASQQLLEKVQTYQNDQKTRIEKLFQNQKNFISLAQQSTNSQQISQQFQPLANEQKELKDHIESEIKALIECYDRVILEPPDLQKLLWLKQDLEIQLKQTELLMVELNRLLTPNSNAALACLVILKQPFPQVISKLKQIPEEQLQVQLLTASSIHIQSITQVKAALLCDITHGKGGSTKALECESQNLDPATRIAKFPLKFMAGTKKAPGNIKFGMQVVISGNKSPLTVESNISSPMIVITNEIQWKDSAGTLLKKEAFSNGQLEISWEKFANTLQHHFLKATRQELKNPRRTLSNYDLHYIQTKFFNSKTLISQKDFDEFWSWFGKAMQTLRYQRHIAALWQNGLIYGFMGREDVDAALNNQDPGTFIMRFSERNNGQFAIAYTGTERPTNIKHYLVQPNDTAAAKKTLPDFLADQPQFVTLLVLTNDPNGNPTFMKVSKHQALEPYTPKRDSKSKSDSVGGVQGYTLTLD